ncbi:diacylglycerol kinase family protein [Pricia sp.]|uniref:diacylglycerol/lipid kinase family protein n=1 Tax=Pricia sp. TaxID=2268138 RepID=UPI0035937D98
METKIKKVLLVINPISGDTEKRPIIDMVSDFLHSGTELKVHETTGKNDIKKIRSALEAFRPDRILVAGGDGTIKVAAEACEGKGITIGILPAGSANGLATDLELPMDHENALVAALGSKIVKMDALRIGNSIGLHISDLGINAELIKKYSESSMRGHFGYFLSSIPTLVNTESPYDFTIHANGSTKEIEAVMVAFANSKKFGTGALVNPDGKIDDGKFEVLIFKKLDVVEIYKMLKGNIEMDSDFVEVIQTTDVRVTTARPVCFQIDGEPFGTRTEVSVSIIPNFTQIAIGL